MKKIYLLLVAVLVFIMQTTLIQQFRIFGVIPNSMLVLIVIFIFSFKKKEGIQLALFLGLLQDVMISKFIGINTIIYVLIAVGLYLFKEIFSNDQRLNIVIATVAATFFYHMLFGSISFLLADYTKTLSYILKIMIIEMIYNLVIAYIIYGFIFKMARGYDTK